MHPTNPNHRPLEKRLYRWFSQAVSPCGKPLIQWESGAAVCEKIPSMLAALGANGGTIQ
jgi:hypothetical protein